MMISPRQARDKHRESTQKKRAFSCSYELLTAGFPCQSFCKAGLKTGEYEKRNAVFEPICLIQKRSFCQARLGTSIGRGETEGAFFAGLNDARGELFFEVLRFIAAHRPASLLLENVPNLVKIDDGAALERILSEARKKETPGRFSVFPSSSL